MGQNKRKARSKELQSEIRHYFIRENVQLAIWDFNYLELVKAGLIVIGER